MSNINFSNTEIAFQSKTDGDLRNSYILFKAIGYNWLVQAGPRLINACFSLRLPVKGLIKATVFKQFCGGEDIQTCHPAIDLMGKYNVGTILDYSVEGEQTEQVFDETANEIMRTIDEAAKNKFVAFSVFKTSGVADVELMERIQKNQDVSVDDKAAYERVHERVKRICQKAFDNGVRLFIDAEESWIQEPIDALAKEMMVLFNKEKVMVYNTLQFYRHDRLSYLKLALKEAEEGNYHYGIKLVRGAYMEKERERAQQMGYPDPIQPDKAACDRDFNEALRICLENIDNVAICCGTHNEESCEFLVQLMEEKGISKEDPRVYFSQLFGMSDHLSYNLGHSGYKVAKYLPYGPVKAVLPYLFRRAQENTSVQGQAGRELRLIQTEMKRRHQH